jgi:hypothetical protein
VQNVKAVEETKFDIPAFECISDFGPLVGDGRAVSRSPGRKGHEVPWQRTIHFGKVSRAASFTSLAVPKVAAARLSVS